MDASRFDHFTRRWATRRTAIGGLLFGGLTAAVGHGPPESLAKKKKKKQKKCSAGAIRCGKACRDVQTDALNCGSCGTRCAAGEHCQGGTCVQDGGGGDCAARCPNGCCDPVSGACLPGGGTQCGKGGEICTTCGFGQACRNQHCCGGNATACDADNDCCNDWVCGQGRMCCTRNGRGVPTTTPLCCDGRDVVKAGGCCRPQGDVCDAGETCCDGASCVDEVCCKALNSVCAAYGDTDCCLGLTCNDVREHGLLCCIPHDQPGCTKDKDCCDAKCVGGVCRQCGTLQTCQASSGPSSGQIFCCELNQTCCDEVGCAPPGGECCHGSPCSSLCDVNGNCPAAA